MRAAKAGICFLAGLACFGVTPLLGQNATVRGQVMALPSGQPLDGALVTLVLSNRGRIEATQNQYRDPESPRIQEGPFRGFVDITGVGTPVSATTDDTGRFEFVDVVPGEYHLYAESPGFMLSYAGTGRTEGTPDPTIRPIGDGDHEFNIHASPGATIRGFVTDSSGEPVVDAHVTVETYQYIAGRRVRTEFLAASAPPRLAPGNSDPIIDSRSTTNELGEYVLSGLAEGEYFVVVTDPTGDEELAPIFYPDSASPEAAIPVRVGIGQDAFGVLVTWNHVPRVPITGRIQGLEPGMRAYLVLANSDGERVGDETVLSDSEGRFEILASADRIYQLHAVTGDAPPVSAAFLGQYYGKTSVFVDEDGVDGIVISMNPPADFDGRFLWQSVPPDGFEDWSSIRLGLAYDSALGSGGGSLFTHSDGTFGMENLTPFSYSVSVTGLPANSYLESGRHGNSDALVGGLDRGLDPSSPLELRLEHRLGTVAGIVSDSSDGVAGAIVTLVPDGDRRGRKDLLQVSTTDTVGRFHFENVPPGTYLAWGWTWLPQGAIESPEFRLPFEAQGQRISVDPLGRVDIELPLLNPN